MYVHPICHQTRLGNCSRSELTRREYSPARPQRRVLSYRKTNRVPPSKKSHTRRSQRRTRTSRRRPEHTANSHSSPGGSIASRTVATTLLCAVSPTIPWICMAAATARSPSAGLERLVHYGHRRRRGFLWFVQPRQGMSCRFLYHLV